MAFSTYDVDNDINENINCAAVSTGAWWYHSCHSSNLNGLYGSDEAGHGVNWLSWKENYESMTSVKMMIRKK